LYLINLNSYALCLLLQGDIATFSYTSIDRFLPILTFLAAISMAEDMQACPTTDDNKQRRKRRWLLFCEIVGGREHHV